MPDKLQIARLEPKLRRSELWARRTSLGPGLFNKSCRISPASGLVVVISANAVQTAPAGLALTISTADALTGTVIATATATATATKAIAMTTLQKALITATVASLAGAGIYETHQASQLRNQVQAAFSIVALTK